MCGIVGYLGKNQALDVILDGLRRLEYRGYDSAGVALVAPGKLQVIKSVGKIRDLGRKVRALSEKEAYHLGIGHTRWATHGRPNEDNAHPHVAGPIALVHNGIIENYLDIREELKQAGHTFQSDTDSEVVAQLVHFYYRGDLLQAVSKAVKRLRGSYALAVVSREEPQVLVGTRKDSPLVLGLGEGEYFLASDVPAILPYTRRIVLLENRDLVIITPHGGMIADAEGQKVERPVQEITWSMALAEKAGYKHFMQKEIFEQPRALADTIGGYVFSSKGDIHLPQGEPLEEAFSRIVLVACGTSWHAALVGRCWIEAQARIPVDVEIASEFRARDPILDGGTLVVPISQSGETADTLAALRMAHEKGARTLAICNVVGSSIAREAQGVIYTYAGPEIGVASTKAFVTQMVILYLLSLKMGLVRGMLEKGEVSRRLKGLLSLPRKMEEVLSQDEEVADLARELYHARDFLYLGRWLNYPIALEGALKLKEISYIHAEGYPGGEMKHGPIALIEEGLPVVAIAPRDLVYEKMVSNVEEVKSRDGQVIVVGFSGDPLEQRVDRFLAVPPVEDALTPFLTVLPLQLLAYYIADRKGCDVDQPRNLAKSVTVE